MSLKKLPRSLKATEKHFDLELNQKHKRQQLVRTEQQRVVIPLSLMGKKK